MEIGLIGLGKMGFNIALNMKEHGHTVMAFDKSNEAMRLIQQEGIQCASSVHELIGKLQNRKLIWLMIPAGKPVDDMVDLLKTILNEDDIVIDGGNSFYKDSMRRADTLSQNNIHFLDCGTSGGMEGARNGICAMIGGSEKAFKACEPLFKCLAVKDGYLYCGHSGSGHFVKMIHNGIEYGMMQAIAEGFEVLHKSEFNLDMQATARVWNHGSVIRSWLMELIERAFSKDPHLDTIKGIMHSSGEGKWTVDTALEKQIATPVIALSLLMRYRSQEQDTFSGKVVAALRNEFGGHAVEKK